LNRVRQVLTVAGFDEAVTASLVPQPWSDSFSPWTDSRPLKSSQPMLGVLEKASQNIGAVEWLRRSLIPSLLEVRRINDYRSNDQIELFETAKVYLPVGGAAIPDQPAKVALASERDYGAIKGVVESLVAYLNPSAMVSWNPYQSQLLDFTRSGELWVNNLRLGVLGEVSPWGRKLFGLRNRATVCELDLAVLTQISVLTRRHQDLSQFPPVSRDFNFVMLDSVSWVDLESSVREVAHDLLEQVHYRETFRDEQKDGPGKKRILFSVVLRSPVSTLTSQQVDELSQRIVKQFKSCFDAELV
jgi:phenylalanyl-tRNA synthetase beta chain